MPTPNYQQEFRDRVWAWTYPNLKSKRLFKLTNQWVKEFLKWNITERKKLTKEQGSSEEIPLYSGVLDYMFGIIDDNQYWDRDSTGAPFLFLKNVGDHVNIKDNEKLYFGTDQDAAIYWDDDGSVISIDSGVTDVDITAKTTDFISGVLSIMNVGASGLQLATTRRVDGTIAAADAWVSDNHTLATTDAIDAQLALIPSLWQRTGTSPYYLSPTTSGDNLHLNDTEYLYIGTGRDGEIYSLADDLVIRNTTVDKDIVFGVNDGVSSNIIMTFEGSTSLVHFGGLPSNGMDALITAADSWVSNDHTIVTSDAIDAHVSGITYWDRDVGNGYIYPSTLTDKVGIGLNDPSVILEVRGDGLFSYEGGPSEFGASNYNTASSTAAIMNLTRYRGTMSSYGSVNNGDYLGQVSFSGSHSSSATFTGAYMTVSASQAWTTTAHGSRFRFYSTYTGSSAPIQGLQIWGPWITLSTGQGVNKISTSVTDTDDELVTAGAIVDYLGGTGYTGITSGTAAGQMAWWDGASWTYLDHVNELIWNDTDQILEVAALGIMYGGSGDSEKFYIGDETTDNSWRWYAGSDGNLKFEKRISGTWTFSTEMSIT